MKVKTIFPILMCGLLAGFASSCSDDDDDDIPASAVPENVMREFGSMFPNAVDVDWDIQSAYYVADFYNNTFDTEAWYTSDGAWAMTEVDYGPSVQYLPLVVQNAFAQSQYGSYVVDDASFYERAADSFCVIEVENPGFNDYTLVYDTFGDLITSAQGDDYDIGPNTIIENLGTW